ncbi:hypothetical protein [Kitasatospora sp. NPDC054795]
MTHSRLRRLLVRTAGALVLLAAPLGAQAAAAHFTDYGFRDQASSWVNTARGLEVIVDNDPGDGQWQMLWKEPAVSLSASVAYDNMADRFWAVRQ